MANRRGHPRNKARAAARIGHSAAPPPVITATKEYEDWLRTRVRVVEEDFLLKHREMAKSRFSFLRATFYRWVPLWRDVCADLAEAPRVLAVGDLHLENFGTWRDQEGRLIWGINDLDEAARMPYTLDLVRLVTSVIIAGRENKLKISPAQAASAVL